MSNSQEQINRGLAEEIKRLQTAMKDAAKVLFEIDSRIGAIEKSSASAETADKNAREAKVALANMHKRVEALEKSSTLAETADKSAREVKVALANMHKRVEALEKKAK